MANHLAAAVQQEPGLNDAWIEASARDLRQYRGRSLVIAGEFQPPAVHAAAQKINETLGNIGTTIEYLSPESPPPAAISELARAMHAGEVETLLILGANPAYDAPAASSFHIHKAIESGA